MSEDFKALGQVLRFPVFLAGVALWTIVYSRLWLGFTLFVTLPIRFAFPAVCACIHRGSFLWRKPAPKWDAYWKDYPTTYNSLVCASGIAVCIIGFVHGSAAYTAPRFEADGVCC